MPKVKICDREHFINARIFISPLEIPGKTSEEILSKNRDFQIDFRTLFTYNLPFLLNKS